MLSPSTSQSSDITHEVVRPAPKSLEDLRPFPKAGPRKTSSRGRKKGKCRVLTATPEKLALEAEMAAKLKKNILKQKTVQKAIKVLFGQINKRQGFKSTKVRIKNAKRKIEKDTSDDESLASFISDESFIDIGIVKEQMSKEKAEMEEDENIFSESCITIQCQVYKWVLVQFKGKKSIKQYVGKVVSTTNGVPTVKFLRRIKKSPTFVWPVEEDVTEVEKEDILTFLPAPSVVGEEN